MKRRAIQLGLRGAALRELGEGALLSLTDVSPWVAEQREIVRAHQIELLEIPQENVCSVEDASVRSKLGLDLAPALPVGHRADVGD